MAGILNEPMNFVSIVFLIQFWFVFSKWEEWALGSFLALWLFGRLTTRSKRFWIKIISNDNKVDRLWVISMTLCKDWGHFFFICKLPVVYLFLWIVFMLIFFSNIRHIQCVGSCWPAGRRSLLMTSSASSIIK